MFQHVLQNYRTVFLKITYKHVIYDLKYQSRMHIQTGSCSMRIILWLTKNLLIYIISKFITVVIYSNIRVTVFCTQNAPKFNGVMSS